jgi:hypothetical protein
MKLSSVGCGRGAATGMGNAAAGMDSIVACNVAVVAAAAGGCVKVPMGEDAGDVVEHGSVHSLALLGAVGVVRKVLADLVLLLAQGVDLGREVHDPPHDRVLITVSR